MSRYTLLLDFGSTKTKATIVDKKERYVVATAQANTTIETTLMDSYEQVLNKMTQTIPIRTISQAEVLICSSAFGGFKMVAIGLSTSLTTSAAKRVALGAGTRILKTFSYTLTQEDVASINQLKPDIVLLTGGTDGGNQRFITNCAKQLLQLTSSIPILIAGNTSAHTNLDKIFSHRSDVYYSDNVMPKINVLNPDRTRQLLRKIFFEKIIYAKGLDDIAQLSRFPIIPTPSAVLSAAKLLAQGTGVHTGWGDLAIIDVGGATTDIHSAANAISGLQPVFFEGLQEPFLKRTVEGDLGMRFSAMSLYETVDTELLATLSNLMPHDIKKRCLYLESHPTFIPSSYSDKQFDYSLAKLAVHYALNRHVGSITVEKTVNQLLFHQKGKDLRSLTHLIGTGGVITHSDQPKELLNTNQFGHDLTHLTPLIPNLYIDKNYLLSALGLLGEHYPDLAFQLLEQSLKKL